MNFSEIKLVFPGDMAEILQERAITEADVREVAAWAEGEGGKLLSCEGGHCLGKKRMNQVTVYLEYAMEQDALVVYNAYSHRVSLDEDGRI